MTEEPTPLEYLLIACILDGEVRTMLKTCGTWVSFAQCMAAGVSAALAELDDDTLLALIDGFRRNNPDLADA